MPSTANSWTAAGHHHNPPHRLTGRVDTPTRRPAPYSPPALPAFRSRPLRDSPRGSTPPNPKGSGHDGMSTVPSSTPATTPSITCASCPQIRSSRSTNPISPSPHLLALCATRPERWRALLKALDYGSTDEKIPFGELLEGIRDPAPAQGAASLHAGTTREG